MHAQKNIYYIKILKIMYLDAAEKQEIFGKYGKSNSDTGSTEAQIALFSYRISHLTELHVLSQTRNTVGKQSYLRLS